MRRLVTREAYLPLLVLVLLGVVLRVVAMFAYTPAALPFSDSVRFVTLAFNPPGLFDDPYAPSGYPAFLRLVRELHADVSVTIAVQHALGIATGLLLYAATRRLGAGRLLSLAPAAALLIGGDQIYLEHALLSETLFTFLLGLAIYAAVRAHDGDQALWWAVLAGAAVACAATFRTVGLGCIGVLLAWIWWANGEQPRRALRAGIALAGAVAVLGVYLTLSAAQDGYSGYRQIDGWSLYARVASFASCDDFDPPTRTRMLCESSLPASRSGTSFYLFDSDSPARRAYKAPPRGNRDLRAFAFAAIRGQPTDYSRAVAKDILRYVEPGFGADRPFAGTGFEEIAFERRALDVEEELLGAIDAEYNDESSNVRAGTRLLASWQQVLHLDGLPLLVAGFLAAAGLAVGTAPLRRGIALGLGLAAVLLVVPAATIFYQARFSVPAAGPILMAAALGAQALWTRATATVR